MGIAIISKIEILNLYSRKIYIILQVATIKTARNNQMNARVTLLRLIILNLLGFFLSFAPVSAQQIEWQWRSPFPAGNKLTCIWNFDGNHVIAAGEYGVYLETFDSGESWDVDYLPFARECKYLHFFGDQRGIMLTWCRDNLFRLYATDDCGQTWEESYTFDFFYVDASFISPDTGWVTTRMFQTPGTYFTMRTCDGGRNWTTLPTDTLEFQKHHFVNGSEGWAVLDNQTVAQTVDRGDTWTIMELDGFSFLNTPDLYFSSMDYGMVVGYFTIAVTQDRGGTWDVAYVMNDFTRQGIVDQGNLFIVSDSGYIYASRDSGSTWTNDHYPIPTLFPTQLNLYDIHGSTDVGYWACGNFGQLLKLSAGGEEWELICESEYFNCTGVSFPNDSLGFLVGNFRYNAVSEDGGITWTRDYSVQYRERQTPLDVFFLNDSLGWICGTGHLLVRTHDGGVTWEHIEIDESTLATIHFIDEQHGFLSSYYGALYESHNSGYSWDLVHGEFCDYVSDLSFFDNLGFLPGSSNSLVTHDLGASWHIVNEGFLKIISIGDICYGLRRVEVGPYTDESYLHVSYDQGLTWEYRSYICESYPHDMYFFSETYGLVVGGDGSCYLTHDGGESWEWLDLRTDVDFMRISVHDDGRVMLYGAESAIIELINMLDIEEQQTSETCDSDVLEVSLFPNPTNGSLTIDLQNIGSESCFLSIYNLLGQQVYNRHFQPSSGGFRRWSLNLDHELSCSGYYFVAVEDASGARSVSKVLYLK